MRKLRHREVKLLMSGGSGFSPTVQLQSALDRGGAPCTLDTGKEETRTPNPSSSPDLLYPLRIKCCSRAGERAVLLTAATGRSLVEEVAWKLLQRSSCMVTDHAIDLQSPRPGTWWGGVLNKSSAGLDLERRFKDLEGRFKEGRREATRAARTTMLR